MTRRPPHLQQHLRRFQAQTPNSKRRTGDWVSWVSRLTHTAEETLRRNKIEDWVTMQRRKVWWWAGHTARRHDGRWSNTLLHWQPTGRRGVGHPTTRWSDCLNKFFNRELASYAYDEWTIIAQDRVSWKSFEDKFALGPNLFSDKLL